LNVRQQTCTLGAAVSRLHWLFFDLGWTLVDETAAHVDRFGKLRSLGSRYSAISDKDFVLLCERHATQFAPSPFLAALESVDPVNWESLREVARYDHSRERLYPGVTDLLERLSESFRLGLIANQSTGMADRLRRFGIHDAFGVIVASAEAGFSKPDPRIFAHAQAIAGCRSEHATIVGDRLDNVIGPAKTAGWRTVRVLQGFSRHQQPRGDDEAPDCTVGAVTELPLDMRW
jgi:HAD superfamily hydrolase (TIGR01549 family)